MIVCHSEHSFCTDFSVLELYLADMRQSRAGQKKMSRAAGKLHHVTTDLLMQILLHQRHFKLNCCHDKVHFSLAMNSKFHSFSIFRLVSCSCNSYADTFTLYAPLCAILRSFCYSHSVKMAQVNMNMNFSIKNDNFLSGCPCLVILIAGLGVLICMLINEKNKKKRKILKRVSIWPAFYPKSLRGLY